MLLILMELLDDDPPATIERRVWTREWIKRREELGAYHTLSRELAAEDTLGFGEYMRMPHAKFLEIVEVVGPLSTKQETHMRTSIAPNERLALGIRYLATGETFQSLSFQFRIGKSTVSQIVMEICGAIYQVLGRQHLKASNTVENWREIATLFYSKWNIPNNIGAIDVKRILIQKPPNAGSHFHDYKGNESVIALIRSAPSYECLHADVDTNGRNSDGYAWARCSLKKALNSPKNPLNIPPPCPLPGASKAVPFVITADEAFSLASYMLKPYPRKSPTVEERIANCRISRGRRISENIVGILANRWRCFRAPFLLSPVKVQKITMAVLSLRNWLNSDRFSRNVYCPRGPTDNENPVTGEIIQGTLTDDSPLESLVSLQPSLSTITIEAPKKFARNIQGGSMMKVMCRAKGKCVDFRDQQYTYNRN